MWNASIYAVCSILSYSCILNHISIGCCGLTSELGRAPYPSSEVSFESAPISICAASVPLRIDRLASVDGLDCKSEGRICYFLFAWTCELELVGNVRSWGDYPFLWTNRSSIWKLFSDIMKQWSRSVAECWLTRELETPCMPVYSGTSDRDERFFRLYCADVGRTTLIDAHE